MEDVLFLAQYLLACKSMLYIDVLVCNYLVQRVSNSHVMSSRFIKNRGEDYQLLKEMYEAAGCPECFDNECRFDADLYVNLIFLSEDVFLSERMTLLKAWTPIVRYTLERPLYIRDKMERRFFEMIAAEKYEDALLCGDFSANAKRLDEERLHEFSAREFRDRHIAAQQQLIDSRTERNAQLAKQNDGQQVCIEALRAENEGLIHQETQLSLNIEQQAAEIVKLKRNVEQLSADAVSVTHQNEELRQQTGALQQNLDAIHRSRVFKMAAKLSKNLRDI